MLKKRWVSFFVVRGLDYKLVVVARVVAPFLNGSNGTV